MYLESSPVTARRSPEIAHRRGTCRKPARHTTVATAAPARRPPPETAAARRTRLDDAIVSQWLLDQLPSEYRHARPA